MWFSWTLFQSFFHCSFFYLHKLITVLFMAALHSRCGHYIIALWFLSLWPPYVIGGPLYFCHVVSFFFYLLLSSFFPRLISAAVDRMSAILLYTWRGPSANLECRSEMCCTRLAANTGRKKVAKNRHLGTLAQLWRAISSQLRHISTIGKNLLSSDISSTCPCNIVNLGLLAAEILSLVWGTPGNFNGFRVLAAYGTLVVGVSQTLRRWTEVAAYIR